MPFLPNLRLACLGVFTLVLAAAAPQAFAVGMNFVEPEHWNVGDADSTYQQWDVFTTLAGNTPDVGYNTAGATLTTPTTSALAPGFRSGTTSNFYSFSGNYAFESNIYNHGGAGVGTHVIVQVASSINDDSPVLATLLGDTIRLTDTAGNTLTGGANGDALQKTKIATYQAPGGGPVGTITVEEMIVEWFLPGYAGDFEVTGDLAIHTQFRDLRVDTKLANNAFNATTVPEPATAMLVALAAGGLLLTRRRR